MLFSLTTVCGDVIEGIPSKTLATPFLLISFISPIDFYLHRSYFVAESLVIPCTLTVFVVAENVQTRHRAFSQFGYLSNICLENLIAEVSSQVFNYFFTKILRTVIKSYNNSCNFQRRITPFSDIINGSYESFKPLESIKFSTAWDHDFPCCSESVNGKLAQTRRKVYDDVIEAFYACKSPSQPLVLACE